MAQFQYCNDQCSKSNTLFFEMISLILFVFAMIMASKAQQEVQQNFRGSGRRGPRRGRRERDRPLDIIGKDSDRAMMKALTINYPLHIFSPDGDSGKSIDWRSPGKFSPELKKLSDDGKPYKELARAQDQEDIWLYENWFYGVERGIIMESGALNGIIFSTSFMFETFANWTAIHVGMYCYGITLKIVSA